MQSSGVGEASLSFPRGITRYQWLVFFVVWAGWSLDAATRARIDRILSETITDPVGPEFMAPDLRE